MHMVERKIHNYIRSFAPVVDECSEALILGTIPGPESLRQHRYYANPNNQFWCIIYKVFGEDCAAPEYDLKVRFLLEHKIALWDVFSSADRLGALDSDIRNPEPNDIPGLIRSHPKIKRILLAGRTAEKAFRKLFPGISVDAFYVPSASSAYAGKSVSEKICDWKNALGAAIDL